MALPRPSPPAQGSPSPVPAQPYLAALAANQGPLPTWIGSTLGEVAANLVAVVIGRQLGHLLSPRLVRIGSAIVFALAGIVVLVAAFVG